MLRFPINWKKTLSIVRWRIDQPLSMRWRITALARLSSTRTPSGLGSAIRARPATPPWSKKSCRFAPKFILESLNWYLAHAIVGPRAFSSIFYFNSCNFFHLPVDFSIHFVTWSIFICFFTLFLNYFYFIQSSSKPKFISYFVNCSSSIFLYLYTLHGMIRLMNWCAHCVSWNITPMDNSNGQHQTPCIHFIEKECSSKGYRIWKNFLCE